MSCFSRRACALLAIALHCTAPDAWAQWQSNTGPAGAALGAVVGSDVERYVRALAVAGIIAPIPWAVRPFGPDDLVAFVRDSATAPHPWKGGLQRALAPQAALGASVFISANSAFPWGASDGPMWQGRGLTGAVGGAATLRWRGLSVVGAPLAFLAQNASFPLMSQVAFGVSPYADPLYPSVTDLPQRMGSRAYARVDGGESTVRIRGYGMTAGVTTASLGWGTGEMFPAIFGANAGGFAHMFAGTSARGVSVPYAGRLNARYVLGVLDQTQWSPVQGSQTYIDSRQSGTRRLGTGLTLSFLPSVMPNLELGASRFYHSPYLTPARRWNAWSKPFEGIFKKDFASRNPGTLDPSGDADNQMASFFARFVFPSRGLEANFELYREDHNWDSRDLAQEPENNSAVLASLRAVTTRRADALALLTVEFFDGDVRPIAQARAQGFLYTHAGLNQGHTQRGQLLGSPIGAGAITGQRAAWERFRADGSLRFNLQRWRTRAQRPTDPEGVDRAPGYAKPESHDWIIDASVASTRYRGARSLTVEGGLAWAGRWQLRDGRTNVYARASWSLF